jgi:hypothetical protein
MNPNIMTDAAEIKRAIKSINTTRTKLVEQIQHAAVSVANHAHIHGDITLSNDLCLAVGNGMKREALRLWLSEFGPMNANDDAQTKATQAMKYAKSKRVEGEALADILVAAVAKPWYDFKTEKPAEAFSFAFGLHQLLGKLEKAVESGYVPSEEEQAVINAARSVPKPTKKIVSTEPTI